MAADNDGGQTPTAALDAFFSVFQKKLSSASQSGRHKAAWRGEDAAQYASELHHAREHYTPFMWGIGCAFVTFASFRISRGYRLKMQKRNQSGVGAAAIRSEHAFGEEQERKFKLVDQAISIPVDLILSLAVGASATLFLSDADKMRDDFAKIPLVKGRSLLSEELCADFTSQSYRFSSVMNSRQHQNQSLDAIRDFVSNCQKRSAYEDQLRKERHLTPSDPVSVPWPGVPPSTPLPNSRK